jgi:ubiquinone/menaquinone biosynthesis C-methylase UbiE
MVERVVATLKSTRINRVLDLGCGTGNVEQRLQKNHAEIIGVDSSEQMLERARRKCPQVDFRLQDLNERLRFEDEAFDAVISVHSLYLLNDMGFALSEIKRVLRPNGRLILVHPLPRGMGPFVRSHLASGDLVRIAASILQLPRLVSLFSSGKEVEATRKGNFLEETELRHLLTSAGLNPTESEVTYGGLSTLIVARR